MYDIILIKDKINKTIDFKKSDVAIANALSAIAMIMYNDHMEEGMGIDIKMEE